MAKRAQAASRRGGSTKQQRADARRDPKRAAGRPQPAAIPPPAAASVVPPAGGRPSADAVTIFERGMRALQRHAYDEGAASFRSLLDGFPAERALLDRARVYLDLCEREQKKRPAAPRTVEERLTAATAALNDEDTARAETLVRSVLAEDARQDLALYLLAVLEARRGNADVAISRLADVIAVSPEASAQARFDPDFEPLRDLDAFRRLTASGDGNGGLGRGRRSR